MSQNTQQPPTQEPSFASRFLGKTILIIVVGLVAAGGVKFYAEKLPPFLDNALARLHATIMQQWHMGDVIPADYQIPVVAGGAVMAAFSVIFTLVFVKRNPKKVALVTLLAAAGGSYAFWDRAPKPTPDSELVAERGDDNTSSSEVLPDGEPQGKAANSSDQPNTPTVKVDLTNGTSSNVIVWCLGEEVGEVGRSGDSLPLELPQFATIHFDPVDPLRDGHVIPDLKLSNVSIAHELKGTRSWRDIMKDGGERVKYYRANKYSHDIRYVDPFDIGNAGWIQRGSGRRRGGMRKKVFQDFNDLTDSTYHTRETDVTDVYIEKHFNARNLKSGNWQRNAEAFGSAKSMRQGMSAGVSVDAEFKDAKSSKSASFDQMNSNSSSSNSVYIYAHVERKLYSITAVQKDLMLTQEFKKAVKTLPKSYDESSYSKFIDDWGTHYPSEVTYGGIGVQMNRVDEGTFQQLASSGFSLGMAANIPIKGATVGGEASLDYTQSSEFSEYFRKSKSLTKWKGGNMDSQDLDSYEVTDKDVQPIKIDFTGTALHTLLTPETFKDGTDERLLGPRREALKKAISLVAPTDKTQDYQRKLYKISCESMQYTHEGGYTSRRTYGEVSLCVMDKKKRKIPTALGILEDPVKTLGLWNRKDINGAAVSMAPGYVESFPNGGTMYFSPPLDRNPEDYTVSLRLSLNFSGASTTGSVTKYNLLAGELKDARLGKSFTPYVIPSGDWGRMKFNCKIVDVTSDWFE